MTIMAAIGENERALDVISVAYDLATNHDEQLVVLHVIPEENFSEYRDEIEDIDPDLLEHHSITQQEDTAKHYAERVIDRALGEYDRDVIQTEGRVGDPTRVILAEAEALGPRYLVIGGRQRSPVGKAVFGSATQSILLRSNCPVVVAMSDE